MEDDTFDDINDQSFVDDNGDNSDNDNDLLGDASALDDWDDPPPGMNAATGNPQQPGGGEHHHQAILSQDHDFQSQVQVMTRSRVGPERSHIPEPRPQNVETEESTCSICFESWTNSGKHRLVSIKCGHLFGEGCISKWIAQNTGNGPAKCPECNLTTTRKDIRRIWSKANLRDELDELRKKHDRQRALKTRYRAEVKQLKMAHPEREIVKHFSYVTTRTIPITGRMPGAAHYLSYRQDEEMLVCSRQMGDKHGIAKVSMRDFSNNLNDFIPVHSKPVKDVQCYHGDPGINRSFVLTSSMDKTLKITNASSKQVVLSYDLEGPVWSCCWSTTDPFRMFCSVKSRQTSILTFDIRNTKAPVSSFSNPGLLGHAPVHSMTHIGPIEGHDQEAILCGSLEGAFVYNFEASTLAGTLSGILSQESIISGSQGSAVVHATGGGGGGLLSSQSTSATAVGAEKDPDYRLPVRCQGATCMSVSFDSVSRNWMASYNFLGSKSTQHVRGAIDQDPYTGDLLLRSEYKVIGGSPVPWSRNSVFTRLNGSLHMAAGSDSVAHVWYDPKFKTKKEQQDEDDRRPILRESIASLTCGPLAQHALQSGSNLQQGTLIKDIKPVVISGVDEYVVTLSDRELGMYRWAESGPGAGIEDESDDEREEVDEADEPVLLRSKGKRRRLDEDDTDANGHY
ncbi:RING finger and WD repeat domain-containing protein 3 [Mortierella sp. NVP41]|nr:RING finger and WD repeat domain-containing protein 3 [Mortierella sp. NVP41]